jgi:hypothetical protein
MMNILMTRLNGGENSKVNGKEEGETEKEEKIQM